MTTVSITHRLPDGREIELNFCLTGPILDRAQFLSFLRDAGVAVLGRVEEEKQK